MSDDATANAFHFGQDEMVCSGPRRLVFVIQICVKQRQLVVTTNNTMLPSNFRVLAKHTPGLNG